MKSTRQFILVPLLLLASARAGGQDAAPSPQEQFNKAADFMEKGQFAEAVPILEALAEEYESENVLWNLGIAATEIHENDKALKVWLQYRKLAPDDWRGRAKLVQAYQATGNMKARDEERAAQVNRDGVVPFFDLKIGRRRRTGHDAGVIDKHIDAAELVLDVGDEILDRLFEGRLADMVSHLLTTREVSSDELARIEQLIAARRRRS